MTKDEFVAALTEREQKDREHAGEVMIAAMAGLGVASKPDLFDALEAHFALSPALFIEYTDEHLAKHAEVRRLAEEGTG